MVIACVILLKFTTMKKTIIYLIALLIIATSCSPKTYSGEICAVYRINKPTMTGLKAQQRYIRHNH
ncbi:MAG: hypothetical protein EBR30_05585 [Cytophagia bacterium]|nr:hypothetical protein [Cytophagia bacterium]NBW34484.1 hypothetical protein [Cytophagia bacterium]